MLTLSGLHRSQFRAFCQGSGNICLLISFLHLIIIGTKRILDSLVSRLQHNLAFGLERSTFAQYLNRRLLIDAVRRYCLGKPLTHKMENIFLLFTQTGKVCLGCLLGGQNGVVVSHLGIVHQAADLISNSDFRKKRDNFRQVGEQPLRLSVLG